MMRAYDEIMAAIARWYASKTISLPMTDKAANTFKDELAGSLVRLLERTYEEDEDGRRE